MDIKNMDIISFLLGFLKGKASSGGAGDHPDIRYVIFMNGLEFIYTKPVATGDDCVDVLTKGLISTPTKESTVDKVFTYSGWADTNGGVANPNVLKAVTENKTVYAAYTASARYYTITYYDSDGTTVLETESLAYGAMPGYVPKKDGYEFDGWTTHVVAVTGDASYTAKWKAAATFATASWSEIKTIVDNGEASAYFKLGDKRTETLTYADGTTEDVTFEIAELERNYDTIGNLAQPKRMVLLATTVLSVPKRWHTSPDYNADSMMFGLGVTELEKYIRDTISPALSSDLRDVALVMSNPGKTNLPTHIKNSAVTIPSAYLVYGTNESYNTNSYVASWMLSKFQSSMNNSIRICTDADGAAQTYWLSSIGPYSNASGKLHPNYAGTDGKLNTGTYSATATERYIRPLIVI